MERKPITPRPFAALISGGIGILHIGEIWRFEGDAVPPRHGTRLTFLADFSHDFAGFIKFDQGDSSPAVGSIRVDAPGPKTPYQHNLELFSNYWTMAGKFLRRMDAWASFHFTNMKIGQ